MVSLRSLLILPVLAAGLVAAPPSRVERRTEPLAQGAKLWVSQTDGKVEVQGWDRPEVELVAEFHDGTRGERLELDVRRVAEGLELEVRHPGRRHFRFFFGVHRSPVCDLVLKVPRKLCLAVHAVDGDISIRNLEGYARAQTVDGDIRLEDLSGEAFTRTVDGSITARNLRARIKGGTVDGDITLEGVEGGVELKTVDGRIVASDLDGWGEGIALTSVDGDLRVKLGKATGHLEARTRDGRIEAHAPGLQVRHLKGGRLEAVLPGRTQAITLHTGDGDIRID
jgi:DUF4097 and DUF4098 domain-containing protein YvlB